jgi:hypothetical protein
MSSVKESRGPSDGKPETELCSRAFPLAFPGPDVHFDFVVRQQAPTSIYWRNNIALIRIVVTSFVTKADGAHRFLEAR